MLVTHSPLCGCWRHLSPRELAERDPSPPAGLARPPPGQRHPPRAAPEGCSRLAAFAFTGDGERESSRTQHLPSPLGGRAVPTAPCFGSHPSLTEEDPCRFVLRLRRTVSPFAQLKLHQDFFILMKKNCRQRRCYRKTTAARWPASDDICNGGEGEG